MTEPAIIEIAGPAVTIAVVIIGAIDLCALMTPDRTPRVLESQTSHNVGHHVASTPFASFFMAGFECSTHRTADEQRRLDLIAATRHDELVVADYVLARSLDLRTVRDGIRWHLVETSPGIYDWSSFRPMLEASRHAGVQVIWDLCHYGIPDDIDPFSPAFITRFAAFARAVAQVVAAEGSAPALYCPVNEISYWAWAGGDVGRMNPFATGRGAELKRQLVRAALAAIKAIRAVDPHALIVSAEPLINIVCHAPDLSARAAAEAYRLGQFEATDMLLGKLWPELGGSPDMINVVGANFYPENQWYAHGTTIALGHHAFRPLAAMLEELYDRSGKPVFVSETGAEGSAKSSWLHYVHGQVQKANEAGTPVLGVCLYPVLDYPGWSNNRPCEVGLFSTPDALGRRHVDRDLSRELTRQQRERMCVAPA